MKEISFLTMCAFERSEKGMVFIMKFVFSKLKNISTSIFKLIDSIKNVFCDRLIKNINSSILKALFIGLKFCFVLLLISTFLLTLYHSIHSFDLFYTGISLFKTSLFYIAFLFICSIGIDTIKKQV